MMRLFGNVGLRALSRPSYPFSIVSNEHLNKDAEVPFSLPRTLSSKNIQ